MKVVVEILAGIDLIADVAGDEMAVTHEHIEAEGLQVEAGLEVEVFAEGEAAQVVRCHDVAHLMILLLDAHDGRSGEDDPQVGVMIVTIPQFARPIGILENLIDEEHLAAVGVEFAGEVRESAFGEEEVVEVDVEAFVPVVGETFAGVGEQKGGLTDLAAALNADQASTPVHLVHQAAAHGCPQMRHQIFVRSIECLHKSVQISAGKDRCCA